MVEEFDVIIKTIVAFALAWCMWMIWNLARMMYEWLKWIDNTMSYQLKRFWLAFIAVWFISLFVPAQFWFRIYTAVSWILWFFAEDIVKNWYDNRNAVWRGISKKWLSVLKK